MRRYELLRLAMRSRGMTGKDAGTVTGLSAASISARMTGQQPWSMEEAYKMLRALLLPPEDIYKYFPPDGIGEVAEEDRRAFNWQRWGMSGNEREQGRIHGGYGARA